MSGEHLIRTATGVMSAAAMQWTGEPADLFAHLADALDSAQLLQSPETAAETVALRATLEQRSELLRYVQATARKLTKEARGREAYGKRLKAENAELLAALVDTTHALTAQRAGTTAPEPETPAVEDDAPLVDPQGCRHCGDAEGHHGWSWSETAGLHQWGRPTQEQIKERMRRRRSVTKLRALLAGQSSAQVTS